MGDSLKIIIAMACFIGGLVCIGVGTLGMVAVGYILAAAGWGLLIWSLAK